MEAAPPFGTDTLVLLTSATALPDPTVLANEPVRRGPTLRSPCSHPLSCLVADINGNLPRGAPSSASAPKDWSIERLVVESLER